LFPNSRIFPLWVGSTRLFFTHCILFKKNNQRCKKLQGIAESNRGNGQKQSGGSANAGSRLLKVYKTNFEINIDQIEYLFIYDFYKLGSVEASKFGKKIFL